jgi:hypothetical protein
VNRDNNPDQAPSYPFTSQIAAIRRNGDNSWSQSLAGNFPDLVMPLENRSATARPRYSSPWSLARIDGSAIWPRACSTSTVCNGAANPGNRCWWATWWSHRIEGGQRFQRPQHLRQHHVHRGLGRDLQGDDHAPLNRPQPRCAWGLRASSAWARAAGLPTVTPDRYQLPPPPQWTRPPTTGS